MWTKAWPEKNGFYWFYGQPYCARDIRQHEKNLYVVEVTRIHKDFVLCVNLSDDIAEYGESLISKEEAQGVWQKIQKPELPREKSK